MYKGLIRPILFQFNAETAHKIAFRFMKYSLAIRWVRQIVRARYSVNDPRLERTLFGLHFPNPVGLAAGFDKDAELYKELSSFGFGFIEVGTVTPMPQEGNPKPRMFRLPQDKSLINRMGFNNKGLEGMVERLKARDKGLIIGGNIGKNKITPNEQALEDYTQCFEALFPHVDYFVVNVSSPNTPNLRALQDKAPLSKLMMGIQTLNQKKDVPKPILLKIAPDLSNEALDDIVDLVSETKIDGLIATNTTIDRTGLATSQKEIEKMGAGGLSGRSLRKRATEVLRYLKERSNHAFPIISVGGVFTAKDAIEKLEAGADLIQVYTGFIYEGPAMVKKINKGIIENANRNET